MNAPTTFTLDVTKGNYQANNEHLIGRERLPSCPVCKQFTEVANIWTTEWRRENRTIERREEGSANRRRAEKKKIRNQKRHERRNRVTQFHQRSHSRGSQGGTTNVCRERTGDQMISDLMRMLRDRPSDLFQDVRTDEHLITLVMLILSEEKDAKLREDR